MLEFNTYGTVLDFSQIFCRVRSGLAFRVASLSDTNDEKRHSSIALFSDDPRGQKRPFVFFIRCRDLAKVRRVRVQSGQP